MTKMNQKENEVYRIIDIVIGCCSSGCIAVTKDDVLGKSRKELLVWIRAITVNQLFAAGYLTVSIARYMNRAESSIRHLMELDTRLKRASRAYKIASEEATLLCKSNRDN